MLVVDALEVIHVDQQDREGGPAPRGAAEFRGVHQIKCPAVREAGQLIGHGQDFELLLHVLAMDHARLRDRTKMMSMTHIAVVKAKDAKALAVHSPMAASVEIPIDK